MPKAQDPKGGTHAHALKSAEVRTATSGSTANEVTAAQSFAYDEAGNTVRRTKAATDLSPAVDQKLDWDEEGRLSAVTPYLSGEALDEANKTSFVYGADGTRLLRKEKGAVTLYLGSQEVRLDTAKNSVSGTRYYSHGGRQIAVRTSAGVTWLVGGQNGTAEIAIRASDSAIVQRRTLPFGEVRGTKPAAGAWPGDKSFVGGTADATTGLIQLGARAYDPAVGRFVSVDPKLNLADPQHLNAYAYGRNNPLAFPDPTGLYWGESWISPIGHGALDVVGLVPGFGEPADLLNGVWYTAEGNYIDAGLSYASAIPIAGYGASAAKGARYVDKAVDAVDAATDTVKAGEKTKDAVKNAENVTPPSTPKPKPPPKPAPPAKPAPPTKKADGPKKSEKADADKPARPKKDDDPDHVYIYKAPYKGKTQKIKEEGFKPEDYPGRKGQNPDGHAYFGLGDKGLAVAEDYAGRGPYDGTVVEVKIPRADFDQYFEKFVGSHNGVPRAEVGIPKEMLGLLNSYPLRVMDEL